MNSINTQSSVHLSMALKIIAINYQNLYIKLIINTRIRVSFQAYLIAHQ